jgi:hypothetical protein
MTPPSDRLQSPRFEGFATFSACYGPGLLKPAQPTQFELKVVKLEQRVPKDHLLRLIDQHIRFEFIHADYEPLYCQNNGRPALAGWQASTPVTRR